MTREDIREEAIEEAREAVSDVDRLQHLLKAVKFLDGIRARGDVTERFRDWYSLHFPELVDEVTDDEELVKVLSGGVERGDLESFRQLAEGSTGGELPGEERELMEEAVEAISREQELEERLEEYVETTAKQEIPNLSHLLGAELAARLVALSGSLEDMAKSPASTIQMLGAEKALFRHLRGDGEPPKHGILFHHDFVSPLEDDKRGKMARFLANKAAMAARLDLYSDKQKGGELREEAQEKFEELRG